MEKEIIRRVPDEEVQRIKDLIDYGVPFEEANKIAEMEFNQDQVQDTQQKILDKYQELIEEQSRLIARQEEQINTIGKMLADSQMKMEELIMHHSAMINSLLNR